MSRSQFVDLYCVQRRTRAEIAAMIGVNRKAAGRLARCHRITPIAGGPPVDPAWFHDQYVTQRRTRRELGHEVGRSVPQMSRIAQHYGIPIRPPSEAGPYRTAQRASLTALEPGRRAFTPKSGLQGFCSHGLTHRTPSGSKCLVLRVATVISAAWATAAMRASSNGACSGTR